MNGSRCRRRRWRWPWLPMPSCSSWAATGPAHEAVIFAGRVGGFFLDFVRLAARGVFFAILAKPSREACVRCDFGWQFCKENPMSPRFLGRAERSKNGTPDDESVLRWTAQRRTNESKKLPTPTFHFARNVLPNVFHVMVCLDNVLHVTFCT